MNIIARAGFVIIVAAVATACSSGYSSSSVDYSGDLAEMKERILELQEQAAVADVEIQRLRQQVSMLESRLGIEPSSPTSTPSRAATESTPSTAEPEPVESGTPDPVISAEVEESDLVTSPPVSTTAGSTVAATTAQSPTATPSSSDAPEIQTRTTTTNAPVDAAAQALYDRGYTLYHQGRYLDAEASFQRFLQSNPSTELSDNAQFWIGESRYARGDIRGALAAFRETLQRYPDGNKVPDALIKEGDCLTSLGDRDGARSRYEEVIRRFPSSAAAIMAEERIAALD